MKAKIERLQREKKLKELEQAEELANIHSDKHIIQNKVRTMSEFMEDQIKFEERKLDKLKERLAN